MKIAARLTLAFLIIALTAMLFIGGFGYLSARQALVRQADDRLQAIADIQLHRLETLLRRDDVVLSLVASRSQPRHSLEQYLHDGDQTHLEAINRDLHDARANIRSLRNISVLTADGRVIASTDPAEIGQDHSRSEFFIHGLERRRVDHFVHREGAQMILYFSAPLRLNKQVLGVLVIEASTDNLLALVQDYTHLGQTGETQLIGHNETGGAVLLTPARFDTEVGIMRTHPADYYSSPPESGQRVVTNTDYRGRTVFVVSRHLNEPGWKLVIKIDRAEILAPVTRLRNQGLAAIFVTSCILILASFYLARTISQPTLALTRIAQAVSAGNLFKRAETDNKDEIGTLATAFNTMTEQLLSAKVSLEHEVEKRTREASESEARYRALFEQAPDAVVLIDPANGAMVEFNDRAHQQLGYSRDEFEKLKITDLEFAESAGNMNAHFDKIRTTGTDSLETRHRRKDGEIRDLVINSRVLSLDERDLVQSIWRDITERKQTERAILQLNRDLASRATELQDANSDLEGFSYSVSHDLRTPLRAIDGFSRILLEEYSGKIDDEGRRLLNVVRDNTVKMSRLIDDILQFSRAGRLELSLVETDMEALTRSVWEELTPATGGRAVQFEVGSLPHACADRSAMTQVLTNLLANAVKFTRLRERAIVEIGCNGGDDETTYFVKDNGVGFDMRYAGKLFGVFQRLHGQDEFEGTGIGLAIVKRIVTKHGGRVWAEGKPNEGATFFFALPRRDACEGDRP